MSYLIRCQILIIVLSLIPSVLCAEFLKTRTDVFQTTDERGKIVISRQDPGIFIAFGRPLNIQLFDPNHMVSQGTDHVFISYDLSLGGYTKLTFGDKRSYRLIGSLSFVVGNFRISIDNYHGYCSIVEVSGASDSIGILGIRGLEPVARYAGSAAVALLEANQLEAYQRVIKNFEYNENGLTLEGTPIEASAIGVSLDPPSNPCIPGKDKVFLGPKELTKIRGIIDAKARLLFLEQILKAQKSASPIDKLILIRITKESAIGIDYERGVVTIVKPYSESKENQICVLEDLKI